jgi:hypothetical protein
LEDPLTTTFHRHWRDVTESTWRWPNFTPAEIACRGTGMWFIKRKPAFHKLLAVPYRLGKPLIVRSAYRAGTVGHRSILGQRTIPQVGCAAGIVAHRFSSASQSRIIAAPAVSSAFAYRRASLRNVAGSMPAVASSLACPISQYSNRDAITSG